LTTEPAEARLKRLKMRSWRRGTKEMDLILGPFSDTELTGMNDVDLKCYDALLNENDQDLYLWVTGQGPPPADIAGLIAKVSTFAGIQVSGPGAAR